MALEKELNKKRIEKLLTSWSQNIADGIQQSQLNAKKMSEGLNTRISRIYGPPIIFDRKYYKKQIAIQNSLVKELPDFQSLIMSEPTIEDHRWKARDYIDLYYNHYLIVIQKLKKAILDE